MIGQFNPTVYSPSLSGSSRPAGASNSSGMSADIAIFRTTSGEVRISPSFTINAGISQLGTTLNCPGGAVNAPTFDVEGERRVQSSVRLLQVCE
jgi:hypothetical protein